MAIELKSFNQILGDMIRKIIAETPLSDVNAGSVLLSLLEACAANDFENNVAILNVLELLNIDATRNNDLDTRAGDFGLSRLIATKASGAVSIYNKNITKQSTGLYIIKPAPISGQTVIYVNNTTGWSATGTLFIGRGTTSFEGPIPYTSIVTSPTFSKITLGAALQKDHLSSDTVINSQGQPDRIIASGTVVKIPANNQNPEVKYVTLRDAILPSGEDSVNEVQVIALVPGSSGNALINTIAQFDTLPFSGAAVANTSSFSNGSDIETDVQLRNRIKSYSTTLARGTGPAILAAVVNVSDPDDNAQVVSAVITQPIAIGEPSILYIDDGSGFQPSYAGQSVDTLLSNANGTEQFLQLANFPLPRPQVVNTAIGPYSLTDSMFLRVAVDDVEDTVTLSVSDFVNISAASVAELVVAINAKSTLFKARLANNSSSILIYPVAFDAEIIQVIPLRDTDIASLYVNTVLKFPTDKFSYISLFQNSTRLHQKEKKATIETLPFASWNIAGTGDLILSVDGTPTQDGSFSLGDFAGASSFTTLALSDWVTAFNKKFAGVSAIATPSQTMQLSSNKLGTGSEIAVSGGSYLNQLFGTNTLTAFGQSSEFEINRETGNLKILTTILKGDSITAGTADAKGFAVSSSTSSGAYNVGTDTFGRPAEMVILVDSNFCNTVSVPLIVGATMTVTNQGNSVMRITSSTLNAFANLQPGYFVYIVARTSGWFSAANSGLFKLVARGPHLTAGTDSYIEVISDSIVPEVVTVADATDIRGFYTDGYPQIWRGTYTTNPPAATISDVVNSLNTAILGVNASVFRSNSIKLTSITEDGGSIAIPVSVGNAFSLFLETASAQFGNPSEVANRVSDKDLFGIFRRTAPVSTNVWLDRNTYTSISGPLTAVSTPDPAPYTGTYSETVQASGVLTPANVEYSDIVDFKRGNNRGLYKSIAAEIVTDSVGTQQGTPRTEFDHAIGDEVLLMQSLKFSAEDNMVFVLDNKASTETIDIKMARTGQVNSGSGASFLPTTTEFSANDSDNEPGIDFSNLNVWGTTINNTNFADYAMLMRARNWYSTGGVAGTAGKMIVRAVGYGSNGNKMQFAIKYPVMPSQTKTTVLLNSPSSNLLSYFFGSGPDRTTAIASGSNMSVKGPYPDKTTNFPSGVTSSGNYYDYTFSSGTFASVQIGDVLSILSGSGVSTFNSGQFGVQNLSGNTVRVFNPSGSSTSPGAPTVSTVNTIADVIGTPTNVTINVTSAAALDGKYFVMYDNAGTVKVWFDVDNNGTAEPVSAAYNRTIKIATLLAADTIAQVAVKIAAYLSNDVAFTNVFSTATQVLYQLAQNGPEPTPFDGTAATGFTFANTPGTADVTLSGKYFTAHDDIGSVAVWYDVGNVGTPQPFAGADRYIKISTVSKGASANTVASATAAALNADSKFSSSSLTNVVTITTNFNASVPVTAASTSGFSVSTVQGSLSTAEPITNAGQLHIFPLLSKDVTSIVAAINATSVLVAAAVGLGSLTISSSTAEEAYAYSGNSSALGYGHNPGSSTARDHIALYDGINWIKMFSNSNPNFTLKAPMTLNGVAPTVYTMNMVPNDDSTTGEYFKLVPTTVKNVDHHFTQKALSQLPIISTVAVSNAGKNVQIKSNQLGSAGAIEVIGGQANKAIATLIGESEVSSDTSGNYLLFKIAAFPDTFSVGDIVRIDNSAGVKRLSRLKATDKINVTIPSANTAEYNYDPKATNFISSTQFTITDVSATYSRPAGLVWRWTHNGGGATLADVNAGDLVSAFGSLTAGWSQGNKARVSGDARVAGLPIINVNDSANWFDVVNPYGLAMSATTIGSGTVQICPTPVIKWNLNHAARSHIVSMSRVTNVVTVNTTTAHFLKTGDSVSVIDSNNLVDGVYAGVTVLTATSFSFASAGADFAEVDVGATSINAGVTRTRYRIEKLGTNGLTRLVRQDGQSPRFTDCGVAVDDYMTISGTTFVSNNNGTFRVLAVDNDSVVYVNPNTVDAINTSKPFNNKGLLPTWTTNNNAITGVAGTFKNLSVGDWVKKADDADAAYLQINSFSPSTPALATLVVLGGNYSGVSAIDAGIAYNQAIDHDKGVFLQNADDIVFYEGDSVVSGDTIFAQNIVDANWFNVNNTGNFAVTQFGTNGTTFKPFLRVINPAAIAQSNVLMSVNTSGFYLVESSISKFYTYRQVYNSTIDDLNNSRRSLYLSPSSRQYKFSQANNTFITSVEKLGYNTDVTIGIDGYLYYTGLLRRVQRIVDGFEPDATNFPGRRAVGGLIETLPPLIKNIIVGITITTDEGVNIGDVSNNIKSAIINYIESLGVGKDVILSEIIASVMQIKGVAAVTFNKPLPSVERITVANNEKATITPANIGIA